MKISIAMTTYNGEKYLTKQLDSLRMQTRKPDQVIIVDDKSRDNTCQMIEEYLDEYQLSNWRLIKNRENVGYRKNFSIALDSTDGDIIFLCDQDDVWYLDKIEKIEEIFLQREKILLLSTSFDVIDKEETIIQQNERKGKSNNNLLIAEVSENDFLQITPELLIKNGNFAQGCCMAFRKELKDLYLAISENRGPHDFELNILAADLESSYFYNNKMIGYRVHSTNTIGLMDDNMNMSRKFNKTFRLQFDKRENLELMKYLIQKNPRLQKARIQEKLQMLDKYIAVYDKRNHYIQEGHVFQLALLNFNKQYQGLFPLKSRIADVISCIRG